MELMHQIKQYEQLFISRITTDLLELFNLLQRKNNTTQPVQKKIKIAQECLIKDKQLRQQQISHLSDEFQSKIIKKLSTIKVYSDIDLFINLSIFRIHFYIDTDLIELNLKLNPKFMFAQKVFYSSLHSIKYFCSNIQGLSNAAQRSVLASAIIRLIINSKPPNSLKDLSLRQRIIELKPQVEQKSIIGEQAEQQIKQLFTTGKCLDSNVFSQFRILLGEQPKKNGQQQRKFIFCPNYLTTQPIFAILAQTSYDEKIRCQNIVITGDFGISKTISIILYIHLSNYIHQFYQLTLSSQQKYKKQLQLLTKHKLINLLPKCWYWSIKDEHANKTFRIQDLILKQISELSRQQYQQLSLSADDIFKFSAKLKTYYPKILLKSVLDQINTFASMARTYNLYQERIQNSKLDNMDLAEQQEILRVYRLRKMVALQIHLECIRMCSNHCVYNSAVNIQRNLLGKSDQRITLGILGHDMPQQIEIDHQSLLRSHQWAKIDFWQYFWFQIYRTIINNGLSNRKINQIQSIFKNSCQQVGEIRSYYRFINVRYLFDKPNFLKFIDQNTKTQVLQQNIKQLLEDFWKYCYDQMIEHIRNFLQKGEQSHRSQKKAYLEQLFYYATRLCSQQQKQPEQEIDNENNHIQFWFGSETVGNHNKINCISYKYDQKVYRFQQPGNGKNIQKLHFSPFQIIEILTTILYPLVTKYIPLGEHYNEFIKRHPNAQGFYLVFYFIQSIYQGTQIGFYKKIIQKKLGIFQSQSQNSRVEFKIRSRTTFTSLVSLEENNKQTTIKNQQYLTDTEPDENLQISIQNNFEQLIKECIRYKNQDVCAIPYNREYGIYQFDNSSPSIIDFVLCKYNAELKKYFISTFDLNISKSSDIKEKRDKAVRILQNLLQKQKDKTQYQITHYILCRKIPQKQVKQSTKKAPDEAQQNNKMKEEKKTIIENQKLSICYATLQEVKLKSEQKLVNITIQIYEQLLKTFKMNQMEEERRKTQFRNNSIVKIKRSQF